MLIGSILLQIQVTHQRLIRLLGKSNPNTYTFSKSLAEQILEREKQNVPLAIVRPSIVTGELIYSCIVVTNIKHYLCRDT